MPRPSPQSAKNPREEAVELERVSIITGPDKTVNCGEVRIINM